MKSLNKASLWNIFIIISIISLTYANSLSNDFIGDDYAFFILSDFFHTPENIGRIFSNDFIVKFSSVDPAQVTGPAPYSGFVSFRPVTAISYFLDYALWRENPAGEHLTNILLHAISAVLVYFLALQLTQKFSVAMLAALLFGVHPVQAEAVNNIGYRSDLFAFIFFSAAFLGYLRLRSLPRPTSGQTCVILGAFFLALFSKETSVMFPFLVLIADHFLLPRPARPGSSRQSKFLYTGIFFLLAFYLYVYFVVFPNSAMPGKFEYDLTVQFLSALKFVYIYALALVNPFAVNVLPPLYSPAVSSVSVWEWGMAAALIILGVWAAIKWRKKNGIITFCVVWTIVTYIPTVNILPVPNPLAFRYLYLPSLGFFVLISILMDRLFDWLKDKGLTSRIGLWVRFLLIFSCASATMALNVFFKDNRVAALEMIKNYPDASRPYWILGLIALDERQYEEARKYLTTYLAMDHRNPYVQAMNQEYYVHEQLGYTYVGDPDGAIREFKRSIELNPRYAQAYEDLAKAYLLKSEYSQALPAALKAIELTPHDLMGYVYAVHSYTNLGEEEEARQLLGRAQGIFGDNVFLMYLRKLIVLKDAKNSN